MFSRVLVACRGEIALRVIRTCKKMGVETVAVYSEVDRNASYLKLADKAYCIGPRESARSYLNIPSIIAAAEIADVEAVHPGYGFLAENARFAEDISAVGVVFIGPPVGAMEVLGDKSKAREIARKAKVPVVPGSDGPVANVDAGLEWARKVGYPVLLKASAGGGGRGMRIVHNDASLAVAFASAKAEAEAAFGDGALYLEKYITTPRHVEIQILADKHGNCIYLGERECSIQRRHQKVIEESPSPAIKSSRQRKQMGEAAVRLMKAAGYESAGTVEFVLDPEGRFYFIEANARIQVEHPVTEMITGVDLVEEQLRVAYGEELRLRQKDVKLNGWAMECRINAEDPEKGFMPAPGTIKFYFPPMEKDVRVDSHVYSGYEVPPDYDSLVAKLIVRAEDRQQCIRKMRLALSELIVEGIPTTVDFCQEVLGHVAFVRGDYNTSFVEDMLGY
ncbi:MAG: acetyl-CoA carboxylase biotin carboxylase subunit [Planctomycetes bacterium]|nr:acetyl-CoA carboxylase biotin carboxylase subunit [Planctomycetota bacterium]